MIVVSIIAFIILLAVLIGIHELGHLLVARANGVFCESISLGMGPVIWEKTDKYNTKWRLSLLPIGGYVKMFGDADASSVREVIPEGYTEEDMQRMSAFRKKPWQRILIALGGPVANFILAIVVLFGLNAIKGVPEPSNIIEVVSNESVAYKSGLRSKDKIISINNNKINKFSDIATNISENVGKKMTVEVERDNQYQQFDVKMYNEKQEPISKLGIMTNQFNYEKTNVLNAFLRACISTYSLAIQNITGIFKIFSKLENIDNVRGPITMFMASKDSAQRGFVDFVMMLAVLSIVLGAVNLLPIPILDGGSVFISSIEWIIGHRLSEKTIEVISYIGLCIVGALMSLGLFNDIKHLFK